MFLSVVCCWPIVVGPPPWLVLMVLLALVNVPSAFNTTFLPNTTSPVAVLPTVPNRFWPEGRSSKSNTRLAGGGFASASNV